MSICSRWGAAALAGSVMSVLVLAGTHAQQATPSPARRAGAANTITRVPVVQFPRPANEWGGYKAEDKGGAIAVGWSVTPEAQKLHAAEVEAANEAQAHVKALANASAQDQEALKVALRDALARQFDAQQKRRSEEIASIEERLGKLKETLQKRDAAKEAIVGKRLDQLMGVKDELAWEETGALLVPVIPRAMNPNQNAARYAPGINPPVGTTIPQFAPGSPILPAPPTTPFPSNPFNVIPTVPVPAGPALPATPPPAPVPAAPALPAPAAPAAAPTAPTPREPGELQPSLELPAAAP